MLDQSAVRSWLAAIHLEKADGVTIDNSNGRWTIRGCGEPLFFRLPAGPTFALLDEIRQEGVTLDRVDRDGRSDESAGSAVEQLGRLWRQGRLIKAIYDGDERVAILYNFSDTELVPSGFDPSLPFVITEDSCIRHQGDSAIIESAAKGAYVRIVNNRILRSSLPILQPMTCDEWSAKAQVRGDVIAAIVECLHSIRAVVPATEPSTAATHANGWSFSDRLLYARSRVGRHIGQYGSSQFYSGRKDNPLLSSDPPNSQTIELERPEIRRLSASDRPFTDVLENRRSIREHAEVPLDLPALGEFLFRAARVTGKATWGGQEVTLKPYPSAGALHELELYPLINRCNGLPSGIYRYDPFGHRLILRAEAGLGTATLIGECYRATLMQSEPQILIIIAAKFAPVNEKYESIAYSLILKNVGCLLQTMHLVSTAMGLAGCILGGGSSDVFCRLVGTQFWKESSVGEFLLGSKRIARSS